MTKLFTETIKMIIAWSLNLVGIALYLLFPAMLLGLVFIVGRDTFASGEYSLILMPVWKALLTLVLGLIFYAVSHEIISDARYTLLDSFVDPIKSIQKAYAEWRKSKQ